MEIIGGFSRAVKALDCGGGIYIRVGCIVKGCCEKRDLSQKEKRETVVVVGFLRLKGVFVLIF